MKKIVLLFALSVALFMSVAADEGEIPIGGRTCPSEEVNCTTENSNPNSPPLSDQSSQPDTSNTSDKDDNDSVLTDLLEYFEDLIG